MAIHTRTLLIACAFGIGLYLIFLILANIGEPVVPKNLDQAISNISPRKLGLKPRGFLEFHKDDDTLKELITKSCGDRLLVPPVVHYVWLSKKNMLFHEYVGMLSASIFVKPCYILIHGDTIPTGEWWDMLLSKVKIIIYVHRQPPATISGKKFRYIEHKTDVMRLEILLEYGGIYADSDVYFLRSFNPLRKYELTLCREKQTTVGTSVMVASKDSVLLKMWYITYQRFNPDSWVENSVSMADKFCKAFPDMVHMESELIMLGKEFNAVYNENLSWGKNRYSVHLFARFFLKYDFTMESIRKLNNTFGSLSRFVLFGKPDLS